jgi:hypothetical protein
MRNITLMTVLMLSSTIAMATGYGHESSQPQFSQQKTQKQYQSASSKAVSNSSSNPVVNSSGGNVANSIQSTGGTSYGNQTENGGNSNYTSTQYPKQSPMAWSPNMAMNMSPENCSNSVSFGASAGFGALSTGAPMDSDACNRRMDARMWVALGQIKVACERMKEDEDNQKAMQSAGITCNSLAQAVAPIVPKQVSTLPTDDYWSKAAATRDAQLNVIKKGK